jgi:hypothetical protein
LLSFIVDVEYYDEMTLSLVSLQQFSRETAGIDSTKHADSSHPNYIIKVEYGEEHRATKTFTNLKSQYGTVLGYHGSPLENFHSIVRNGLDATFGKETSLFGEGIYLSANRDVAFSFLKPGPNRYAHSLLGPRVGCIVCAEVACKPRVVRQSNGAKSSGGITIEGDDNLPPGYIVAEDNDCVQIKYILIYNNFAVQTRSKNYVCLVIAVLYVFLLVVLWLMKSMPVRRFLLRSSYT